MQVAYRARNLADAQSARQLLTSIGIPTHIPDQAQCDTAEDSQGSSLIRVLVDNRFVDDARRAIQRWLAAGNDHK